MKKLMMAVGRFMYCTWYGAAVVLGIYPGDRTVLQLVGAHYTFEHVPMEWLMKPLGLVRNPYDRIAHFAVGWFAFPLAELFFRKNWVKSAGFARKWRFTFTKEAEVG